MRLAAIFASASIATGVASSPLDSRDLTGLLGGADLSPTNCYGAPNPPWTSNSNPGWYYGSHSSLYPELPCLGGLICFVLELLPLWLQCPHGPPPPPPPTPGSYTQTFHNLTGATQASDYMTYGLVDTIAQCQAMCNGATGCKFVNTYHDVNGKGGSTQLTCSLFRDCHTATDADNDGGQTQPNGSVDYITNSDGWCKN